MPIMPIMPTKDDNPRPRFHRWTLWPFAACVLLDIAMAAALLALVLSLASCRTARPAIVPQARTAYRAATDTVLLVDTVLCRDSVSVRVKGDTVWQDRWHERTAVSYRWRTRTDTLWRTDTVALPAPVSTDKAKAPDSKADKQAAKWRSRFFALLMAVLLAAAVHWRKPLWKHVKKIATIVSSCS